MTELAWDIAGQLGNHVIENVDTGEIVSQAYSGVKRALTNYVESEQASAKVPRAEQPETWDSMSTSSGTVMRGTSSKFKMPFYGRIGKFKKPKKTLSSGKYLAYGSVARTEIGGTASSFDTTERNAVYIGHSTFNRDAMFKSVGRALYKMFAKHMDWEMNRWEDPIEQLSGALKMSFRISSFLGLNRTPSVSSFIEFPKSPATSVTPQGVADLLAQTLSDMTANGVDTNYFDLLQFFDNDGLMVLNLPFRSMMLSLKCTSVLSIQNRTSATTSDEGTSLDVDRNPIVGRRYIGSTNGLMPRETPATSTVDQFYVRNTNNVREFVPPVNSTELIKPPPAHFFYNCKSTSRVHLAPGEIKKSYLTIEYTVPFNKWARMHRHALYLYNRPGVGVGDKIDPAPMHKCEFFGFEKSVNTRESSEPAVKVGYESTYTISSSIKYKKNLRGTVIQTVDTTSL